MEDNNTTPLLPSKGLDIVLRGVGTCTDTDIRIPNDVKSIFEGSFFAAEITSVSIPQSVTSIDPQTFFLCNRLINIKVAAENKKYHSINNCIIETETKTLIKGIQTSIIPEDGSVVTIGEMAFFGCQGLRSIKIPDGIKSISDGAFAFAWLEMISIPTSVIEIGCDVFSNGLKIIYAGTKKQWESIKKGTKWFSSKNNKITIHCKDGDIEIRTPMLN